MIEREANRDGRGRVGPRNNLAAGRQPRVRVPQALINLTDEKLRQREEGRSLADFVAEAVLRITRASTKGDLDASKWLVDRFSPAEREPAIGRKALPSPTKRPAEFVDALARSVARGQMTTTQAARLANLANPLIIDEALRGMVEDLAELQKRVDELGQRKRRSVQ